MKWINRAAFLAAVLLGTSAPAAVLAQHGRADLPTGEPVRLTVPSRSMLNMVGTIEGPAEDGFLFQPSGGREALVVPCDAITRLEVRRRHSNAGAGALLGGLAGAAVGAVAAATDTCNPGGWCLGPGGDAAGAIVAFGLVGVGLGALIGSAIHTEGWRSVPIPQREGQEGLMVSAAKRRGIRIGWTLRL